MKIGVHSTALAGMPFEEGLAFLESVGVESIEIACAGWFEGKLRYADPDRLLADGEHRARWKDAIEQHGLTISALAIHGRPLSPVAEVAREYSRQFEQACRLAETLGIDRLTLLAGLPEGAPGDTRPYWVTGAYPPENAEIYEWQWEQRALPYWREHGNIAEAHGCRLCFEMHPADLVHNPAALLRLRDAIGSVVACNFDPSHLFWQGIDPLDALRAVGDIVSHVHAKDTRIDADNSRVNGVLDPTPVEQVERRAWCFRTVGYGHDEAFWRDLVVGLRSVGYDDVLSIEHEDELFEPRLAVEEAVALLDRVR